MSLHKKVVSIGLATVALGVVAIAAGPVGAQGPTPSAQVVLDPSAPVAWEPFTVQVQGEGCDPGVGVEVAVTSTRSTGAGTETVVEATEEVTTDGDGAWQAELTVASAWPGRGAVDLGCGITDPWWFTVADPPGFTATAEPTEVVLGVPTDIDIAGEGCNGDTVQWFVDWPPFGESLTGSLPVGPDGSWAGRISVLVNEIGPNPGAPPGAEDQRVAWLRPMCEVVGGLVPYPVIDLAVIDPSDEPQNEVVAPRFTG